MPTKVSCQECGFVLLDNPTMPDSYRWYDSLYDKLLGKCPECGRVLPPPSQLRHVMQVNIRPATGLAVRKKRSKRAFKLFDRELEVSS